MAGILRYLVVGLIALVLPAAAGCPSGCTCLGPRIDCDPNSISQIPNTGEAGITQLNIRENVLSDSSLSRNDFSHLQNLEELTLSNCGIETIGPETFADLTQLTLLDLSFNNLRSVDRQAFAGLTLNYLFLGDNPSISLPPAGFTAMSTEIIDLKNCELTDISTTFIAPLFPTLHKLYINGNKIKQFPQEMEDTFDKLDIIRIHENPIVCDCQSRWLKRFYDENTDKIRQQGGGTGTDPRCSEPAAVAGEFFSRLQASEFLCERPSLSSEVSFTEGKGILICTSKAYPPPKISWYKPDGSVQVTSPTDSEVTEAQLEVVLTPAASTYECVASNEAGNTSLSVDLTQPQPTDTDGAMPCADVADTTTGKEVIINGGVSQDDTSTAEKKDVFKVKYFTIVHIIVAIFGTFAGTLVVTVIVLHACVYKKRKSAQYGTSSSSEYSSGGSVKNESFPSTTAHSLQIRSMAHLPTIQNRPLPTEPRHKVYDENHYMSTQLADNEDLVCFGQHNAGAMISPHSPPTCQCQPTRAHSRHSQML